MSQIFKLFKLQFDEKFDILKTGNKKKMFGSILKYVLIIAVLTFVCYALFLKFVLLGFVINKQLISIILLASQVVSLLFGIGHIIKVLFQNKDNELLMSMPVHPQQVFVSKILLSYIQELIVNACITLPLMISIGLLGGFNVYYYVMLPVLVVLLPILPTATALLMSIPVLYIIKFFQKHSIVSTILILATVVVCVILYSRLLSAFAESFNIVSKQIETVIGINISVSKIGNANAFYLLLAESVIFVKSIYKILIYILTSAVVFVIAYYVVKPFFFKIAMSNLETSTNAYKEGKYRKRSQFASLLYNECLNVFRSPGIIFEYFLFTILMPFVVVVYDNLLLGLVVNQSGQLMINGAHLLIVAVFATLSNIYSASAISREGANFYILKSTPVGYYTQTAAKIVFNAIFSLGAIVITGIVACFYMHVGVAILTTLICIFLSLGHMFSCFDNDIKAPTLDWYDSGDISKVNSNITRSIVKGLLLAVLVGVVVISLSSSMGLWAFAVVLVGSLVYCLYKAYVLVLRVSYQYERLEP
ncbi:MAG: hypothetical protein E7356_05315 [Clostridiales bacterium]|nr:hypothetical protein [Clostridiales bacterium]